MKRVELPLDVRRFVQTSIPSVPYIEALLLLRREPSMAWGVAELAQRIYVSETQAAWILKLLEEAGFAVKVEAEVDRYRYQPQAQLGELLDRVAQSYATNLLAVTDLIHSGLGKRAANFADAFRIRKD
jgi:DNA-binding MarR family transcriptional regulator